MLALGAAVLCSNRTILRVIPSWILKMQTARAVATKYRKAISYQKAQKMHLMFEYDHEFSPVAGGSVFRVGYWRKRRIRGSVGQAKRKRLITLRRLCIVTFWSGQLESCLHLARDKEGCWLFASPVTEEKLSRLADRHRLPRRG